MAAAFAPALAAAAVAPALTVTVPAVAVLAVATVGEFASAAATDAARVIGPSVAKFVASNCRCRQSTRWHVRRAHSTVPTRKAERRLLRWSWNGRSKVCDV